MRLPCSVTCLHGVHCLKAALHAHGDMAPPPMGVALLRPHPMEELLGVNKTGPMPDNNTATARCPGSHQH